MAVTVIPFGSLSDGRAVAAWRLEAAGGSLTVLDYGATIQALTVPDKNGRAVDVVLGYDDAAGYETGSGYLGATIGRVGNRIGGAAFSLGGTDYALAKNDGQNHLHGGLLGFDKQFWTGEAGADFLRFSRRSPDGEEGYPGNLDVIVTFRLAPGPALEITYAASSDRDTLVNLTNHSYFNLNGGGSVLDHVLTVNAERYCENDGGCLPTGRLPRVEGTPFDFRQPKAIGRDIGADCEQLRLAGGYDHNFVLSGSRAATVYSPETGIVLAVETDLPGMQLYTANGLTAGAGKGGAPMGPRQGLCLETQLFPNAMACWGFPSPVLRAGQSLRTVTRYAFSVR